MLLLQRPNFGRRHATLLLSVLLLLSLVVSFHASALPSLSIANHAKSLPTWRQELRHQLTSTNTSVIALIFYGRRESVSILASYLEHNLKGNGGIVNQVQFLVRTDDTEDLLYLEKLLERNPPEYVKTVIESRHGFMAQYQALDPDSLYLKIDDDVMYISEDAIDALVAEKLKRPQNIVSANVINHPLLTAVHARHTALRPFEPYLRRLDGHNSLNDWRIEQFSRISELEEEDFEAGEHGPNATYIDLTTKVRQGDNVVSFAPVEGFDALGGTHAENAYYWAWDECTWASWVCAGIAHYSLFDRLQTHTLEPYHFGTWDFHSEQCDRFSINFLAFYGRNILEHIDLLVDGDDEMAISYRICEKTGLHSYAVGRSVVSHYAYGPQRDGLSKTDILQRYRLLALEETGFVLDYA